MLERELRQRELERDLSLSSPTLTPVLHAPPALPTIPFPCPLKDPQSMGLSAYAPVYKYEYKPVPAGLYECDLQRYQEEIFHLRGTISSAEGCCGHFLSKSGRGYDRFLSQAKPGCGSEHTARATMIAVERGAQNSWGGCEWREEPCPELLQMTLLPRNQRLEGHPDGSVVLDRNKASSHEKFTKPQLSDSNSISKMVIIHSIPCLDHGLSLLTNQTMEGYHNTSANPNRDQILSNKTLTNPDLADSHDVPKAVVINHSFQGKLERYYDTSSHLDRDKDSSYQTDLKRGVPKVIHSLPDPGHGFHGGPQATSPSSRSSDSVPASHTTPPAAKGWSPGTAADLASPHTDSVKTPAVRPLPFSVEALLRA